MNEKNYGGAAVFLESIIEDYSYDLLADNAIYQLALLKEERLDAKEEAMELYKKLMTDFPDSLFVVESRKRFRALRGDFEEEDEFFKGIN